MSRQLLSKHRGSLLANIAAKIEDARIVEVTSDGCPFIDRDPGHFEQILFWLRVGQFRKDVEHVSIQWKYTLKLEAEFYGIQEISKMHWLNS